jgi:hypothetical protein
MAYTKYSLTPANNTAAPPDGAPEGMLPSAVNDTMRDMMAQIRDCGDGIRDGTYTMTAPKITGGTITGSTINNSAIGATTASTGKFTAVTNSALTSGRVTYAGTAGVLQDDADFTFNGTTVTMANDASISGLTVGKGAGSNNGTNVGLGSSVLAANTTAYFLTAVGHNALTGNTTGLNNTAVGMQAGYTNSTGTSNVFVGKQTGYSNTTGGDNSFLGVDSGYANTTGASNTAIGSQALRSNTTGSYSTVVGYQAGYPNTTGQLTAIGALALRSNTTGTANDAFGVNALNANTTGSYNVALGDSALQLNTTASNNTAVGYQAGYSQTTANENTCIGYLAGNTNLTSSYNVYVGSWAGKSCTGASNTLVGAYAGFSLTTGSDNTFIGNSSNNACGGLVTTGSKNVIIGNYSGNQGGLDIRTSSNYIVLSDGDGNPRIISDGSGLIGIGDNPFATTRLTLKAPGTGNQYMIYGLNNGGTNTIRIQGDGSIYNYYGTYGTISDARLKENIVDATPKLADLMQIQVRNYNLIDDESKTKQIGVIAQELETVFPNMVTEDEDGNKAVKSAVFVPMLIKAIQELNAKVIALETQLNNGA